MGVTSEGLCYAETQMKKLSSPRVAQLTFDDSALWTAAVSNPDLDEGGGQAFCSTLLTMCDEIERADRVAATGENAALSRKEPRQFQRPKRSAIARTHWKIFPSPRLSWGAR
jgi:hypothetical protein